MWEQFIDDWESTRNKPENQNSEESQPPHA